MKFYNRCTLFSKFVNSGFIKTDVRLIWSVLFLINFMQINIVYAFDASNNNSEYNDTYDNLTLFNQNISYFDFNNETFGNISNFDASTELETTISVTEDTESSLESETNSKLFLFLTADKDICNCDLSTDFCDINCCCDPDCNEQDMQVFSECYHQVLTPDENYCYQQDIILRNNTVYKIVKNPKNGMFCIVHDNFKHHLRYKDMPALKSHRDLVAVLKYKYKTTYSWDTESESLHDSCELRAGNLICIDVKTNKETLTSHWSLPSSCLSDMCTCKENVRYLQDFRSSCSHVIDDLQKQCEDSDILSGDSFTDFCFNLRSAPYLSAKTLAELVIHTKMVNTSSDQSDDYYSSQALNICASKSPKRPKKTSNACLNVVRSINFTVEHDGSNGITGIFVDFGYADIGLNSNVLTQDYSVSFVWSNVTNVQKKSGNPGYQMGLPILAAANGSDVDPEEMSRELYKEGLSVLGKDGRSFCSSDRQVIKFGSNLKTGCFLKHDFTDCKILQNKVSDTLLGPSRRQIFIGAFGNANISDPDDWIEVFHEINDPKDEDCFVSLGLKIDIVYAAVGTIANPQYKILGVGYHYSKPEFVDLTCKPLCRDITLWTSVSFFDVTLPAVEHYAKVPSIKANLPSDFFYPFMYGRSSKSACNVYGYFIFLWCIIFLFFT